jgi:hypothetical protein
MTPEQYSRWARFAIRMAHRGWKGVPRKSRRTVANGVKAILREVRDHHDLKDVGDWDGYVRVDGVMECVPVVVSDLVLDYEGEFNPFYYEDGKHEGRSRRNWAWREKWWSRVECCLRAGLDLASGPSAGVLGFEICDLRRMYRNNIPTWINNGEWENPSGEPVTVDLNRGECAVGIWL